MDPQPATKLVTGRNVGATLLLIAGVAFLTFILAFGFDRGSGATATDDLGATVAFLGLLVVIAVPGTAASAVLLAGASGRPRRSRIVSVVSLVVWGTLVGVCIYGLYWASTLPHIAL